MVEIRQAGPDDWQAWRELRLNALLDSPGAFGSSHERERERDERFWRNRLSGTGASFVASVDGSPVGMVGAYWPEHRLVELVSMWVAPAGRRLGVGSALVGRLVTWAGEEGAQAVGLWVARGNDAAESLYSRHGFIRTGMAKPLPSDPEVEEFSMRLSLTPPR